MGYPRFPHLGSLDTQLLLLHGGGPHLASGKVTALSSSPGHGNFPYLCGNLNDVVVSPLLYTCYQNSQSISRAYEQCGASSIQPISEEMQLLLTVYYLVQLGEYPFPGSWDCTWEWKWGKAGLLFPGPDSKSSPTRRWGFNILVQGQYSSCPTYLWSIVG